jgi:hypothetical protein
MELNFWARLVLAVLATWRITHLLAREDGPADLVVQLRALMGSGFFGRLLDCFYCLSLWVAAPLAFLVVRAPADLFLTWLALSGAACLLERLGQEPVVIQPLPEMSGEANHGMLWTETVGDDPQADGSARRPGSTADIDPVASRVSGGRSADFRAATSGSADGSCDESETGGTLR